MHFDHDKSWKNLQVVFNSKLGIKDAWNKIIDFHKQIRPKIDWQALYLLKIEAEQVALKDWIEQLVISSPLPDSVVALWIGILKIQNDGKEVSAIYLAGADAYGQDTIDWACDPVYLPKDGYVYSGVLNQIDEIIQADEDNYAFLNWILPLAYIALTLDEIIRLKLNHEHFLTGKEKLFVATGYDSGDYLNISNIQ